MARSSGSSSSGAKEWIWKKSFGLLSQRGSAMVLSKSGNCLSNLSDDLQRWGESVRLVIVGPFPFPAHGFAQATREVANLLRDQGRNLTLIGPKLVGRSSVYLQQQEGCVS